MRDASPPSHWKDDVFGIRIEADELNEREPDLPDFLQGFEI
jgi:hypothetical protein